MSGAWGIYIHIPFCPYQCIYCDFDAGVYPQRLRPDYVQAVLKEIAFVRQHYKSEEIVADTIYFGGGTPSLLDSHQLHQLIAGVRDHFTIEEPTEITIEANPESITQEKAHQLKQIGVTRVSLGAQSFIEAELRSLGRGHTAQDVCDGVSYLREAGLNNVNLDLIGGLPGQSIEDWFYNLDQACSLQPAHLSMYLLEVHEDTMLADLLRSGRYPQPDDDLSVQMYQALIDRAEAKGYEHYELSNYCQPGFQSHHNLKYWSDIPYIGFGCSAASYDRQERRVNVKTPGEYIKRMNETGQATDTRTPVTVPSRQQEALFLGLRRMQGVDLNQFQIAYGVDVRTIYQTELQTLLEAELVTTETGRLRLTRKGMTLSNEVFAMFV